LAVNRQNAATKQLRGQYTILQQANSALEDQYRTAEFAVLYYRVTGQKAFLYDFAPAKVQFAQQISILRRHATPETRDLITIQAKDGATWFAMMPRIVASKPGTPDTTALMYSVQTLANGFDAANSATQQRLYEGIDTL